MKRFLKTTILICVLLALSFTFASCEDVNPSDVRVTVSVVADDYDRTFEVYAEQVKTVEDVLKELKANENNEFTYEVTSSEYGSFITSVCGIVQDDTAGKYWMIYTDTKSTDANGVTNVIEESTYVYGVGTYYLTAKGISQQNIGDGEHLVFVLETFVY